MEGELTSKRFDLLVTPLGKVHLTAAYYLASATCQGEPRDVRNYEDFEILEDNGNRYFRKITARERETGTYFDFNLGNYLATVHMGDSVPVQHNPLRRIILERGQ